METHTKRLAGTIPVEFLWTQNIKKGILKTLRKNINTWDQQLRGIVQSYEKIRIKDTKFRILEEVGVVLVPIKYTVKYFSPEIGTVLQGVVKNWSNSEIGGLVNDFNALFSTENLKYDKEVWIDENENAIQKNSKVNFILEK
jgi:DNA-directed RNA polymerase subunit E'/Rpb7